MMVIRPALKIDNLITVDCSSHSSFVKLCIIQRCSEIVDIPIVFCVVQICVLLLPGKDSIDTMHRRWVAKIGIVVKIVFSCPHLKLDQKVILKKRDP
jgi:uncharacterized membrane protein YkvI